jgi:hypothetical protein
MDSIFNDLRIWITFFITIISTLIGFIAKRLFKDHDILFEKSRKADEERDNLHSIITGHIQYHQGLKNGEKDERLS